jgi:MoaA/NifB/PqqE/SkfB family radical SAM enzyme
MITLNLDVAFPNCQKSCPHCVTIPHFVNMRPLQKTTSIDIEKFIELNIHDKDRYNIVFVPCGESIVNVDFFEIIDLLDQAGFRMGYISTNLALELTDAQLLSLTKIKIVGVDFSSYKIPQSTIDLTRKNYYRLKEMIPPSTQILAKRVYHPFGDREPPVPDLHPELDIMLDVYPEDWAKQIEPNFNYKRYFDRLGIPRDIVDSRVCFWEDHLTSNCTILHLYILPGGKSSLCLLGPFDDEPDSFLGNVFEQPIMSFLDTDRARAIALKIWNKQLGKRCKSCRGGDCAGGEMDTEIETFLFGRVLSYDRRSQAVRG